MRSSSALAALFALAACKHAAAPAGRAPQPPGTRVAAAAPPIREGGPPAISEDAHALLRQEAELLWTRWTTGAGPMPASALAEHPALSQRETVETIAFAASKAKGTDAEALRLLWQQLATLAVAREAGAEIEALQRGRAELSFQAPPDAETARIERGERDLDRLLSEEPSAQKRAAIALAEARAAQPLLPLAIARDAAVDKAIATLGLPGWGAMEERAHRMPLSDLAALAEKTLVETEAVASRAVAQAAVRSLGVTTDRMRRADLARLVRQAGADPQFAPGKAWPLARAIFTQLGAQPPASLRIDADPSPSKGARPLALLVDPPADVRLSLRPAGGYEEQRATLHEGARALGGVLTQAPRWELAQLGDGSAAEGAAQLFEALCGDPEWLRQATQLRGEPLDDLVHTEATRRLLAARRAAALVLFEIQRRSGPRTAEAQAALYRGLIQRATFAVLSDEDAGRWALEADAWIRVVPQLTGALLAAQLETAGWWRSPETGAKLRKIWAGGRSLTAIDAARSLGQTSLDPAALSTIAEARLSYRAPEAPPPTPKPDYKYMQGDKKKRRHRKR